MAHEMYQTELWDILDEQGRQTGKTVRRGGSMSPDEFHLVVDVWIRNQNNRFLISKRAPNKPVPNMWETTSGAAISGEDGLTAAIREAKEEVGVELKKEHGRLIDRQVIRERRFPTILESWLFDEPIIDQVPICQAEEVSEAKWAGLSEIKKMIQGGVFINHLDAGLLKLD